MVTGPVLFENSLSLSHNKAKISSEFTIVSSSFECIVPNNQQNEEVAHFLGDIHF